IVIHEGFNYSKVPRSDHGARFEEASKRVDTFRTAVLATTHGPYCNSYITVGRLRHAALSFEAARNPAGPCRVHHVRMAHFVMLNSADFLRLDAQQIGYQCGTSEATVVRFCRRTGTGLERNEKNSRSNLPRRAS